MIKTISWRAGALVAATLLTALSAPASAALVRYEIESGTLGGQSYTGSLVFDDTSTLGVSFDGFPLYELLSFSFSHDGTTYAPTPSDLAASGFGWVVPTDGSEAGLELSFGNFSFLPGVGGPSTSGGFRASLSFDGPGGFDFADVTYRLIDPTVVPEPASLTLALAALVGLGAVRRAGQRR
jgi:hypothetical protein